MGLPYAGSVKLWGCLIRKVQVCAEHKKPRKLLKMLDAVATADKDSRSKSRVMVFCNKIKTVS